MIQLKEEFKNLIPPLTQEEFRQLEQNIIAEGIRENILTWQGIIIDGHNRYKIATKWGLEYETTSKHFKDEEAVKEWMILNQFGRRNLSNYQRSVLALELEEVFTKKAKENLSIAGSKYSPKEGLQNSAKVTNVDTRKELSKVASVSHDTITRVKKIEEKADEETKAKLRTGEISINQVYTDIKKQEKREEQRTRVLSERNNDNISTEENIKNGDSLEILETLPDESIDIVLTDPPYGISYISNRSIFEDTITKRGLMNDGKEAIELLDKTCEILSRKAAKNSHLYFFCSWSVFSSFESIIGKYFTIKTPIVWDKGNKGSGDLDNDWGNQTEIVIFCTKGKKLINKRLGNIINVPRMHTSKMIHPTQKPEELLKTILDVSYIDGDFVVDPFMGSGSTIKVANNMGAKSLGIELDNEMFQIANKYLKNA
jgi:DNA modification methylase